MNYRSFCKKGLACTGRPVEMGGDGSCMTPFHIHGAEFGKIDEVKAHNNAVAKAAGSQ